MKPYKKLIREYDEEGRVIDSNELDRIKQNSGGIIQYSVYIPRAINSTIHFKTPQKFKGVGTAWHIGTPPNTIFINKKDVKSIRTDDEYFIFFDLKKSEGVIEFKLV